MKTTERCDACGYAFRVAGHAETCGDYLNDADSPVGAGGHVDDPAEFRRAVIARVNELAQSGNVDDAATLAAQHGITDDELNAPLNADRVWLLTVNYDHDGDDYMMEHQSIHRDHAKAMHRLFDVIYANTGATPGNTHIAAESTRDDGARFADLVTEDDERVSYGLVPMVVEP